MQPLLILKLRKKKKKKSNLCRCYIFVFDFLQKKNTDKGLKLMCCVALYVTLLCLALLYSTPHYAFIFLLFLFKEERKYSLIPYTCVW